MPAFASLRVGSKARAQARVESRRRVQVCKSTAERAQAIKYYDLDEVAEERLREGVSAAFSGQVLRNALAKEVTNATELDAAFLELMTSTALRSLLFYVSKLPVFSDDLANVYSADLISLGCLKKLKYFLNVPVLSFVLNLAQLAEQYDGPDASTVAASLRKFSSVIEGYPTLGQNLVKNVLRDASLSLAGGPIKEACDAYLQHAKDLEVCDPHAVYPTSIYRQCFANVRASPDSSIIEGVMGTNITTTIKIVNDVLDVGNRELRDIYVPLGRCIAVVDQQVEELFSGELEKYFEHHGVELHKLVYGGMEKDKDISTVQAILKDLKMVGVSRNEPVLVVGGGVIADVAGFATALYHRNTPYVMLCTSVVSGIDAGPSPRTCCDGFGYKNIYGAYHPPILTLTDRAFFRTLHTGWVRHGISEIAKMAIVKDFSLFELLESTGADLVASKLGSEGPLKEDADFQRVCDLIIGKAMASYVQAEYGNLWETHQCRPHAYGHTWSPGYEIPAGMLHGHAMATCMGFGAFLAFEEGMLAEEDMHRILRLLGTLELAIWHPILDDTDCVWASQVKMTQKRGGNLAAPVPSGTIGSVGYINYIDRERLNASLAAYKKVCEAYPRNGRGIEEHCTDVGLEPAGTVGMSEADAGISGSAAENGAANGAATNGAVAGTDGESNPASYQDWIQERQSVRTARQAKNLLLAHAPDTPTPPDFPPRELFHDGAEKYAMEMTTLPSAAVRGVDAATEASGLFAPCMVGQLEGQFLKSMVLVSRARSVLDIGTFTGYSALAFAEGLPGDGKVVTIENDAKTAEVAAGVFAKSGLDQKIELVQGNAVEAMQALKAKGCRFDIVFIDADKENYKVYFEMALDGLLSDTGFILADNTLTALVYDEGDNRRQAMHEFNQIVRSDPRVEQVVLTVREGVTMIIPKRV